MADFIQPFNKILEQYLFSVTTEFIDLVDQQIQSDLINLINRVSALSASVVGESVSESSQSSITEWQQVLSSPVNLQSVHNQWLVSIVRQRIHRQNAYITHIEDTIRFTEQHGQLLKDKFAKEPFRSNQLHRNMSILKQYKGYLASAYSTQKVFSDQLSLLLDK